MSAPAAQHLMDLATGYWASAALNAAITLDLFTPVEDAEPAGITAAALAARCPAAPDHTAALLDALVALDLLEKADDRYRFAADAAPLLRRDSEQCLIDALRFNVAMYPMWGGLADCVRTGCPVTPPKAHLGDDADQTRRFVRGMHSRAQALAPAVLPHLDVNNVYHLLDVGAGPGTFTRLLAEQHPELRVTQLDLPGVVAVARELTADSPAADRIDFIEADYRGTDFTALPQCYDALLYAGALHQESTATAASLLGRLADALQPAGRLMIFDMMLQPDRAGPAFSALFDLNMKLINPQARVFAMNEVHDLLAATDRYIDIQTTDLPHTPYAMVTARKAAQ